MKLDMRAGLLITTAVLGLSAMAQGAAAHAEGVSEAAKVETVTVTATKNSEREIDVAIPVTAVSAEDLAATNSLHIEDYAGSIPGLSIATQGNGRALAVIRGISTGRGNNPTVGFTVDDVPIGSSTSGGIGDSVLPEIDPSALQQVEVLRGPQGSLYGASSMGGLIRFVTKTPDLNAFSGQLGASGAAVAHGSQGYGVRGFVNTPLLPGKLALQANAYYRTDPGYTDNIRNDDKDYNVSRSSGGRLAVLWQITPKISYQLSGMLQTRKSSGSTRVDVDMNRQPTDNTVYENDRIPGTNIGHLNFSLYSGKLNADLGFADLTAITAYSLSVFSGPQDASSSFDKYLTYMGYTDDEIAGLGSAISDMKKTGKFTQEVRLSSKKGGDLDWMVGAFFTRETSEIIQDVYAADYYTGVRYDDQSLYTVDDPSSYNEYALFGSATYHVSQAFDVEVGGRISAQHLTYLDILGGTLNGGTTYDGGDSSANVFTWSLTPRYHLSEDMMVYGRIATGYRPGGVNTAPDEATTYGPDRTTNYEIGFKGVVIDDLLTVDASLFDIEWRNVQLEATSPTNFSFIENGGSARSRGFEISTGITPGDGWTISANFSFVDATLREDITVSSLYGEKGERLPFSSKTSGSIGVDKRFPITADLVGTVGAKFKYTGSRYAAFPTSSGTSRFKMPAYGTMDLHASLVYQNWDVSLYANNVFDQVGFTYAQSRNVSTRSGDYDAAIIAPRTVGISVTRNF